MVDRVSNVGSLLQDLAQIQQNKTRMQELQYRLSTGKKFQELKDYGTDATRLVDLKTEIDSRDSYTRSIELTESITKSYDNVLERLVETASEVVKSTQPQDPTDSEYRANTEVIADNLLLEIEANLNIRIGDRYIFAGTNYGTPPVEDMRNLALYDASDIGTPNAVETSPNVPEFTVQSGGANITQSYHASFTGAGSTDANAHTETEVTISDNQRAKYGITATDPAFQKLIDSVMRMKSAAAQGGLTRDERESLLGEARSAAEDARVELRQLQSRNGTVIDQMNRTKDLHASFSNISENTLGELENASTEEAAVQLSTLQSQIQSSFSIIARRSQLSLTNFLS